MRCSRTRTPRKVAARKVADAAGHIFLSRQDCNPYELDYHLENCDEPDLFGDDDTLISEADAAESGLLECPACAHQFALWSNIVESTGNVKWGHRAYAALELDSFIEDFKPKMKEIDAAGWNDVRAVRAERARLDAQRQYNQQQEAKRNQKA